MMSENPENRMPLSQPARSVAGAPPVLAFAPPVPARFEAPRDARGGFAEVPAFADAPAFADVPDVADVPALAAPAAAPAFAGRGERFDVAVGFAAASGFTADFAAASGFDACAFGSRGGGPGRPGTAGRRETPDDRGGRGASGCIAPPHRPGKENGGGPAAAPVMESKPFRP